MSNNVGQKKRGRPATGANPKIAVRMADGELAELDAFASQRGLSRSEAARQMISAGLARVVAGSYDG